MSKNFTISQRLGLAAILMLIVPGSFLIYALFNSSKMISKVASDVLNGIYEKEAISIGSLLDNMINKPIGNNVEQNNNFQANTEIGKDQNLVNQIQGAYPDLKEIEIQTKAPNGKSASGYWIPISSNPNQIGKSASYVDIKLMNNNKTSVIYESAEGKEVKESPDQVSVFYPIHSSIGKVIAMAKITVNLPKRVEALMVIKKKLIEGTSVIVGIALLIGALLAFFLSRSVNKLLGKAVSEIIVASTQLSSSSQQASIASQQISSIVQQAAAGATQQSRQAEEVSNSMAQMASAIQQMSASIQEASANATRSSQMSQTAGESAEKIAGIAETITGIAEQTNLLALNAAIEAARAGEAGRGFAVVADEVRKLAENTGKAVGEVKTITKEVTNQVSNAASSVQDVSSKIQEISAAIQQQAASVQQIAKTMDSVAAMAEQNASGAQQVSASVQQQSSASQQIAASAKQLQELANEWKKLVGEIEGVEESVNNVSAEEQTETGNKSDLTKSTSSKENKKKA